MERRWNSSVAILRVVIVSAALASYSSRSFGDEAIDIEGTFREYLGAANGRDYDITNKTGDPICDFTITIEKQGGGDPGATITEVQDDDGDGIPRHNFEVDDNLDGDVDDANEGDDVDSTPGTTTRIQAADDGIEMDCIPPDGTFDMNITLSGITNGNWCITIQPTDKGGRAIGKGLQSAFTGSNTYEVDLHPEAAEIAPYTGLAFNDVNETGAVLQGLFLEGLGFQIVNAIQKDANGDEIPGSFFSPFDNRLVLATPVLPGEQFFFAVEVDVFFGGVPMQVVASVSEIQNYIRGDSDGNGNYNPLLDGLHLLSFGFQGGLAPICPEAADADDDGMLNSLVDAFLILGHGFLGGPAPAAPFPGCGPDPDLANSLGCDPNGCP